MEKGELITSRKGIANVFGEFHSKLYDDDQHDEKEKESDKNETGNNMEDQGTDVKSQMKNCTPTLKIKTFLNKIFGESRWRVGFRPFMALFAPLEDAFACGVLGNLPGAPTADLTMSPSTSIAAAHSVPSRNNGSSSSSSSSSTSSVAWLDDKCHTHLLKMSCSGDFLANSAHQMDLNVLSLNAH